MTLSVVIKCEDGVTTTVTSETAPVVCKFCVEPTSQFVPQSEVSNVERGDHDDDAFVLAGNDSTGAAADDRASRTSR